MMKKLAVLAALIAVLCSGFCGSILMNAMADDHVSSRPAVFYKSIEIRSGDTLWSIAEEYAPQLDLDTQDYIQRLREMNRLHEDTIHAGRHLTVMYSGGTAG